MPSTARFGKEDLAGAGVVTDDKMAAWHERPFPLTTDQNLIHKLDNL
jgi:hypothetical protein